jgi:hypothetical protein
MLHTYFHLLVFLIGQNLGTFKYINAFHIYEALETKVILQSV